MAQLTWKNVDAPNFNDVNSALASAGEAIHRGFQASRQAIDGFEKDQTDIASAQAMAATMGVKDPNQIAGILSQFHPGYLSAEALKFAGGRPQDLANLAQTQATTAGIGINNQFNQQANPLRIAGLDLDNKGKVLNNANTGVNLQQNIWNNANTRSEHAALPAWNQEAASIRSMMSSGDPTSRAMGLARLQDPTVVAKATAAGIKDIGAFIEGSNRAALMGVQTRQSELTVDEKQKEIANKRMTEEGFKWLSESMATPSAALREAQNNTTWPADVKAAIIAKIEANPKLWPSATAVDVLSQTARPPFARQGGGGGNAPTGQSPVLTSIMDQATAGGDRVTSGFRSPNHPLSMANPNSAHTASRAFDLRARTAEEADAVMARQRARFSSMGLLEGRDFKIRDEVRNPVGYATGPHIHVELTPEGKARLEGGGSVGGMGDRVTNLLAGKNIPIAPFNFGTSAPGAGQGPGPGIRDDGSLFGFTPGLMTDSEIDANLSPDQAFERTLARTRTANSAIQAAADTSTIDAGFGGMAPLVDTLANRPNRNMSAQQVAQKVWEETGKSVDTAFWRSKELSLPVITEAMNHIQKKYGLAPDVAAAFIQSAVGTTSNFFIGGADGRKVDYTKLEGHVKNFVNIDGPNKGQLKTEYLNLFRQKEAIQKRAVDGQALITEAKQEYIAAEAARRRGNTKVNVEAAKEKLEKAIEFATRASNLKNPVIQANTAGMIR